MPVSFDVDGASLTSSYRALQQVVHPDKFAAASPQEKRFSMQAASYINEAYRVLGDDLQRAGYLLSLNGIDINNETDTQVDPVFLMTQMTYREQLENIASQGDPFAAVDTLRASIAADVSDLKTAITSQLADSDFTGARETTRKWQFLVKLKQELSDVEHQLEEAQDL